MALRASKLHVGEAKTVPACLVEEAGGVVLRGDGAVSRGASNRLHRVRACGPSSAMLITTSTANTQCRLRDNSLDPYDIASAQAPRAREHREPRGSAEGRARPSANASTPRSGGFCGSAATGTQGSARFCVRELLTVVVAHDGVDLAVERRQRGGGVEGLEHRLSEERKHPCSPNTRQEALAPARSRAPHRTLCSPSPATLRTRAPRAKWGYCSKVALGCSVSWSASAPAARYRAVCARATRTVLFRNLDGK